jgi:hypothetical protein
MEVALGEQALREFEAQLRLGSESNGAADSQPKQLGPPPKMLERG